MVIWLKKKEKKVLRLNGKLVYHLFTFVDAPIEASRSLPGALDVL